MKDFECDLEPSFEVGFGSRKSLILFVYGVYGATNIAHRFNLKFIL